MPLYLCQFAYTSESWAAQLKKPQNRIETVGRQMCEAAGGKFVGGWYCFGDYDAVFIADRSMPRGACIIPLRASTALRGMAGAARRWGIRSS
jgi:uncharacterized protein with GYD domain